MAGVASPFIKSPMIRTLLFSRSLPSIYTSFAAKEGISCACLQMKPLVPVRSMFRKTEETKEAKFGMRTDLHNLGDTRYVIHTVKAKGFPNNVTPKDVADFFHDSTIAENGIHISRKADGHTSGTAFVEFATRKDKTLARKRTGEKVRKRYIEVNATTRNERLWFFRHRERDELATSTTRSAPHVIRINGLKAESNHRNIENVEHPLEPRKPIMEKDVRKFFENANITVLGVTFTTDQWGNSMGEAYIGLDSEDAVSRSKEALEASGSGNLINSERNRIVDSSPEKVRTWDPIYFAWKHKKGTSAGKSDAKDAKKGGTKKK